MDDSAPAKKSTDEKVEKVDKPTSDSDNRKRPNGQDLQQKSAGLWVEDAIANINYLEARHLALTTRFGTEEPSGNGKVHGMSKDEVKTICKSVGVLLRYSRNAAYGLYPDYQGRLKAWWSGRCAEAAYKNMHYAEATLARLYNEQEIKSQVLDAVRRARTALADGDITRQVALIKLTTGTAKICTSEELSEVIALGHEAADRNRSKLSLDPPTNIR
jgi:hypothetical protein